MRKARIFNQITVDLKKEFEPGDMIELQVMRVGKREHPEYGTVEVDQQTLNDVINNFNNRKRGIDIVLDENHERDHKALGVFRELYIEGDALFAKIELTRRGAEAMTNGDYFYFSPEIVFGPFKDEETGEEIKNLLTGGALTNRPFFKKMNPVKANEGSSKQQEQSYLFVFKSPMEQFRKLLEEAKKNDNLPFSEKVKLISAFNELSEEEQKEVETEVQEVTEPKEDTDPDDGDDTGNDDGGDKEPVKASESFKDSQEYKKMSAKMSEMERELKQNKVEKLFNEQFAFSQENTDGIFNPVADKEAFTKLYMSFTPEQAKMFSDLMGQVDVTLPQKFQEHGYDAIEFGEGNKKTEEKTEEQKFAEAAKKKAEDEGISIAKAMERLTKADLQ